MNETRPTPTEEAVPRHVAVRPDRSPGQDVAVEEIGARRGLLVRLAYRFCWNREDAEDAVQNALLLAADRRDQLADGARWWSWVRAIVVRQCHDLHRRAGARHRAAAVSSERHGRRESCFYPSADSERREAGERIRAAIGKLPERQQTAVVLRHLEEMSYAEIAEIMNTSESTVRVQVRNAREALRRILCEDQGDDVQEANR